ncbi:unnamed protein product [Cuscuta europaea]|uniref:F-box domain-containing protein n=1 Tax=Cuscuta europaea TaxID=41803 RepID=A0A9P0Z6H9_CUSEU|nr:unnamed protein product [Cuscuta europaea]
MACCLGRNEAAQEDRISQLPGDVKDRILEFLDTRSAARTALLSNQWKDVWFHHGRLVIDWEFQLPLEEERGKPSATVSNTISDILFLRSGPVKKFGLHIKEGLIPLQSDIDRWCLFLSRNGVEEFSLCICPRLSNDYNLPVCIVSCPTIKILSLDNLFIDFSVKSRPGSIFPGVKSVNFCGIIFLHVATGIVYTIPNLEKLFITLCDWNNFLINAPKLKTMEVMYVPLCGCD